MSKKMFRNRCSIFVQHASTDSVGTRKERCGRQKMVGGRCLCSLPCRSCCRLRGLPQNKNHNGVRNLVSRKRYRYPSFARCVSTANAYGPATGRERGCCVRRSRPEFFNWSFQAHRREEEVWMCIHAVVENHFEAVRQNEQCNNVLSLSLSLSLSSLSLI